ncbi:MAG: hypothetical protein ABIW76_02940 [Fibrobacteria bacterium]
MAGNHTPNHAIIDEDPDLTEAQPQKKGKKPGKGGSRKGFVSKNEIEDMTIFDKEPGKSPSKDSS